MIDTFDELTQGKNVYILSKSIWRAKSINYAVYRVQKLERRGVNRWFAQFTTNARNDHFRKTINQVGGPGLYFKNSDYMAFDNLKDLQREYCKIVKKDPEKNPELTKKLLKQFPQYFV